MEEQVEPLVDVERGDEYWHDRDVSQVLGTLAVTDYEVTQLREDLLGAELTVTLNPIHLQHLLEDRHEYLAAAQNADPALESVVERVVGDVARALDAEFNTVGHKSLPEGLYRRVNERQWKEAADEAIYDNYSDLLWEVVDGRASEGLSVPVLREPFLEACAQSDEHTLPHPGAVDEILLTHIRAVKKEEQSRAAVSRLTKELEAEGVNPRTASRVAQNMDDLLVTDAELAADDDSDVEEN